jgi:uncharacterized protein YjiK
MIQRVWLLAILFYACSNPVTQQLPFDFDHPQDEIKLPEKLHEISGISLYSKNRLACVQDEKGIIFFYDFKKDKLKNTLPFGDDRDYEAITNVRDTLYVLCSNGVIYQIDSSETGYSNRYRTFLSKSNNTEGLCFDSVDYRLLVACKGKPEKKTAAKGTKAIYSFNLSDHVLNETPAYVINPDSVKVHLITQPLTLFQKIFGGKNDKQFEFEPSDIGIDPITSDLYILSSVGNSILCLNRSGQIKFAYHLNGDLFKQPEGITFAKDGTMLISDEGRKGKANLIRLKRNNG